MGLAKLGTPYLMVIAGRAIMGLYCGKTEPCLYFHGILREEQVQKREKKEVFFKNNNSLNVKIQKQRLRISHILDTTLPVI